MNQSRVLLVLLLVGMLLVNSFPSALAQRETPQGSTPDSRTTGSNLKYIIKPQDLAALGQVQVIVPEQPVEKAPIQGWIRANTTTIAVSSTKPGAYVGELAMAAYQFSSPQAVREALAAIELPTASSRKGLVRGVDVFEPELAESVATLNLRESTVYWEDEDGFQNYGAWFQIEDYFVDVRLIAFASVVADDPAISPSLSADEQATLYGQLLSQKFAQNVPFNQLVNRDRAKWFGKRLLNVTLKRLLNVAPEEGSRDQMDTDRSVIPSASPGQSIAPDWYGSGVQAQTWTHQTSSGGWCAPLSLAEDCHHRQRGTIPIGISAVVANNGDNPPFTVIEAVDPKVTPAITPGVFIQLAEDIPLAAPPVNMPVLPSSPDGVLDIWLYVPRFGQTDPTWSGNVMQTCGKTIGNAGCLLTSAAMVFKYYGATSKNPGQLNTCMANDACPWQFAPGANSCSENKVTWNSLYGFSYSTLVWALSSDWPPILELTSGGNTHWVVVNAVRGDGLSDSNYRISDPLDGTVKTLASYTNNGWTKNRIAVYTKQ